MKKIISILITLVFMFAITACDPKKPENTDTTNIESESIIDTGDCIEIIDTEIDTMLNTVESVETEETDFTIDDRVISIEENPAVETYDEGNPDDTEEDERGF